MAEDKTVGGLLRSSMRKIGVLAAGEPIDDNESDDVLQVFRDMAGAWSLESLLIPVVSELSFELFANLSVYTIGNSSSNDNWNSCQTAAFATVTTFVITGVDATADFNAATQVRMFNGSVFSYATVESSVFAAGDTTVTVTGDDVPTALEQACISVESHWETARPEKILAAYIRDSAGTDYIQEIIEVETFSRISRKTNASRPSRFYVQEGWPLNTIKFESVPYADEFIHLSVVQPLSGILPAAELTEIVDLPPGYRQVLIYNLAVLLAPEWGKTVTREIAVIAVEGKKRLKRNNYRSIVLGMDRAVATQRKGLGTYIIEQGP